MTTLILIWILLDYGLIFAEALPASRWARWAGLKGMFSTVGYYN